jgi:hypothetical protein
MSQASAMLQPAQLAHQRIVMLLERGARRQFLTRRHQSVVEVLPSAEAAAGAGDHDRATGFVGFDLLDRPAQFAMHRVVKGVEPVRPVEGDDAITGAAIDEDGWLAHDFRNASIAPTSFFSPSKSSATRS